MLGVEDLIAELGLVLGPPPMTIAPSADLPPTGLVIDQLPEIWGCTPAEALARLARMEIAGQVRRSGDMVLPR